MGCNTQQWRPPPRADLGTSVTFRPIDFFSTPPIDRFEIAGTSGNDTIVVRVLDSSGKFTVSINGQRRTNTAASIVIATGAGDDDILIVHGDGATEPMPVTIYGGDGNDTIVGSFGREKIFAGAGDDVVAAGNGNDAVYAEAGNDYVRGGAHNDRLDGGDGADTLRGDAGNDFLAGGAQPDRLRGSAGNDTLLGHGGRDHLAGEDGDASLVGHAGNDVFSGGRDNDTFADFLDGYDLQADVTTAVGSSSGGANGTTGTLQFDLIDTRVSGSTATSGSINKYNTKTIWLLNSDYVVLP